jgi:hypothetical protein
MIKLDKQVVGGGTAYIETIAWMIQGYIFLDYLNKIIKTQIVSTISNVVTFVGMMG